MKKGFTLLELIVVLIIIGILATLGLSRFGGMMEKARSGEARAILGDMRKLAAAYYMEYKYTGGIQDMHLNLGTGPNNIPSECRSTHYFFYYQECWWDDTSCELYAWRCTGNQGKQPGGKPVYYQLSSNFVTGNDTWGGPYPY